jgi:hypothetical protein
MRVRPNLAATFNLQLMFLLVGCTQSNNSTSTIEITRAAYHDSTQPDRQSSNRHANAVNADGGAGSNSPGKSPKEGTLISARFKLVDQKGLAFLTEKDITEYRWKTHTIVLNKDVDLESRIDRKSIVVGIPFTVVADGYSRYTGVFTTGISSIGQSCPVIEFDRFDLPNGTIQIQLGYPTDKFFKGEDPRSDERIRNVLDELGKLR